MEAAQQGMHMAHQRCSMRMCTRAKEAQRADLRACPHAAARTCRSVCAVRVVSQLTAKNPSLHTPSMPFRCKRVRTKKTVRVYFYA
eukprot:6194496-Pleurochrysis_carterae.AAC.2